MGLNIADAPPFQTVVQSVQVRTIQESSSGAAKGFHLQTTWSPGDEINPPLPDMRRVPRDNYGPLWMEETENKLWLWEPGLSLVLDLDARTAEAQLSRPRQWQDILRVLYFHDYLSVGGLLFHAAAVARDGVAYVFPGLSGAGKTTIVRQSAGMTIFNDEMAAVRIMGPGRGVIALGTPFHGEWGQPGEEGSAQVKGLFFPTQDRENRLVPLAPAETMIRLAACLCLYTAWQPRLEKVFDLCLTLVASIPSYAFHFRPDPTLWEVLH